MNASAWRAAAACAGADPAWFEEPNAAEAPRERYIRFQSAFAVCAICPVTGQCLSEGMRNAENGVWGGVLLSAGRVDRRTDWSRQPSPRELVPCGTQSAYARHRRYHEQPCRNCVAAHTAYEKRRRMQRRAKAAA